MVKTYSLEEVKLHNTKESLWIVIDDHVFDLTDFTDHPGGFDILLKVAGTNATEDFNEVNHVDAYRMMEEFCIGKVE